MTEEMTSQEEQNFYEEVLQNDGQAIEAYIKQVYSKSAPPPQPPIGDELSFWKIAGLESSLFVLSGVGAAILSAIRTGGLFYILEVLLIEKFGLNSVVGNGFGFISMISALFAFEGFLLAYGLTKGKQSGKIDVSRIGLGISLTTVISAGIFSSFSIVAVTVGWQLVMNILLAIITGGASALVAFYASENLGFILNHVNFKKNEILSNHQRAYMEWREEAVAAYLNSAYNIRLKKSQKVYGKNDSQQQPSQVNQGKQQTEDHKTSSDWRKVLPKLSLDQILYLANMTKDQREQLANERNMTPRSSVNWQANAQNVLMERYIQENNTFPSTETMLTFGMDANSAYKFVIANSEYLLNNNLIDSQMLETAKREVRS